MNNFSLFHDWQSIIELFEKFAAIFLIPHSGCDYVLQTYFTFLKSSGLQDSIHDKSAVFFFLIIALSLSCYVTLKNLEFSRTSLGIKIVREIATSSNSSVLLA